MLTHLSRKGTLVVDIEKTRKNKMGIWASRAKTEKSRYLAREDLDGAGPGME